MDRNTGLALQLQVNTSGAWKTVLRFVSHVQTLDRIKHATNTLVRASENSRITWRIATTDALPVQQMHWSAEHGWRVS